MKKYTIKTKEVNITAIYDPEKTEIIIKGKADLQHHLLEEIIFLLCDNFNLHKSHMDIAGNVLKARAK